MSQYYVPTNSGGTVPGNVPINFVTQAGTAVSVANSINVFGAGATSTSGGGQTITITTTSNVIPWTDEAVSFLAAVNNGYFATAALTATLPAGPTQGQVVVIEADTTGAVVIQANTGQFIRLGTTISAVAGTATSSKRGDSIYLVFRSASLTWQSISTEGTWALM